MKNINSKAIQPFQNAGCGFFLKETFITAGHCIQDQDESIMYDNKKYVLNKCEAEIFEVIDKNIDSLRQRDIAIFKIYGYNGPILNYSSNEKPIKIGDRITIGYYEWIPAKKSSDGIGYDNHEVWVFKICRGTVIRDLPNDDVNEEFWNNYFEVESDVELRNGNSGSPAFDEEMNVIGCLVFGVGGNRSRKLIFQKLSPFNEYILK